MKIRLIVIGRDRHDPLRAVADEYLDRVRRSLPCEVLELDETPLRRSSSPERVMAEEAARIERALGPDDRIIGLDRDGRELDSLGLARRLEQAMVGGTKSWALVVGGPLGLHPDLLSAAHERWRLSALTLPHRIARLVLCEQIYRAVSIQRGEPYHK